MENKRGSNSGVRWIQRGVIAIAVVALLAGAAYVWGNRLSADTLQTSSQRTEASSSGSLRGLAAVRSIDAASRSRGVAGVRAIEASAAAARVRSAWSLRAEGSAQLQKAAKAARVRTASSLRAEGFAQLQKAAKAARVRTAWALRAAGSGYIQKAAAGASAAPSAASILAESQERQHKGLLLGTPAAESNVKTIAPAAGMPSE